MLHNDVIHHLLSVGKSRIIQTGQKLNLQVNDRARLFYLFSGSAKLTYTHSNGRSQIMRFMLNRESFGGLVGTYQDCDLTFMENSSIVVVSEAELARLRDSDPAINFWLYEQTRAEVHRLYVCSLAAGMRVDDKIMLFMKEYQEQCRAAGRDVAPMSLPMPFLDIADYLSISPETFSRRLKKLVVAGSIDVYSRRKGITQVSIMCDARKPGCSSCEEKRCREVA